MIHTHSRYATAFAQAQRTIPCLGTTHADYFHGPVPLTRYPDPEETARDYEAETGQLIVRHFRDEGLDPAAFPGVLVSGHGPFTWGATVEEALTHALVLEEVARMALDTLMLRPDAESLPDHLRDKHFLRKHGKDAYYGQPDDSKRP